MTDWTQAACLLGNPDAWYPERGDSNLPARRVCLLQCPIQQACMNEGLANRERFGIWGGLSERDRRKISNGVVTVAEVVAEARRRVHEHEAPDQDADELESKAAHARRILARVGEAA